MEVKIMTINKNLLEKLLGDKYTYNKNNKNN